MPYVITEACINVKDKSCVDVCPVDCIYEGEDQLYIHPDECIDCGACEPECPVTAIFPEEDVPQNLAVFVARNRDAFFSMYSDHSGGTSVSGKMACTGHSGSQAPQSMHSSGLM